MKLEDPHAFLSETARRTRGRRRREALVMALPPIGAAAIALAAGWLGPELARALGLLAALGVGALIFHSARMAADEVEAAQAIDRRLAGKDHFLTLATSLADRPPALWPVVETRARILVDGERPESFLPAIGWKRILASAAVSLAVLLAVPFLGSEGLTAPTARLEEIAGQLASLDGDPAARTLGHELLALAAELRSPRLSKEEKRRKIAEAKAKLDRTGDGGGGESKQGETGGRKGGGQQQGSEERDAGESAGQGSGGAGSDLRRQASRALGEIEGSLAGEKPQESKEQNGEKKDDSAAAGGVKGPGEPKGAGERKEEGAGNRPADSNQQEESEGEESGEGGRESRQRPDDSESDGLAKDAKGASGEGAGPVDRPAPSDTNEPVERYYEAGEGEGWRIEDGRTVRVRVPEPEAGAEETETVSRPGDPRPSTPFGNAPPPSAGPAGEPRGDQPLPLEYRDLLTKGD